MDQPNTSALRFRAEISLESALKTAETAQASLHAERVHSRATLFTEEEFRSLQLQVREVNLLRESNIQLREENKHNFEECQKLREVAQRARTETERLETFLKDRQTELEACKKEIEKKKVEREHLEKRVDECKNIDVEDYDRMRDDIKQMQTFPIVQCLRDKEQEKKEKKKNGGPQIKRPSPPYILWSKDQWNEVHQAQDVASKRGKLLTDDFLFLIRQDLPKLNRCTELFSMNEELKQAREAFEVDEEKLATIE